MTNTYLMSRPGRPLHLMTFAYDTPSQSDLYPTGHHVPVCGSDRGIYTRGWTFTGQFAERWAHHRRAGLCGHCLKKLERLIADAFELDIEAKP